MRFHFYLPRNLLGLIATLSACSCWCSAQEPLPRVKPLEPANTLSSFQIEPGFALELLASEPMVMDPVAMVYDEQGRAFVAEMRDYPFVDKANDNAFAENTQDVSLGQIRMLEDVDGDGKFDKSTVFAEQLSWPTGLALWQGGLYVVATPDLWYLKDTDGDGKADVRRRVFAGFRKFNVQAVINNLKWGLDHKLYAAGSSNGGKIMHSDNQSRPAVTIGTGDFCFDPRREEDSFELLSGGARFGNDFDDQGNRFICNIRNPIQHPVLPRRYLTRNPFLPSVPALQDVAVSGDIVPVYRTSPPEPWRILNAKRLSDDATVASPRSESAATGYMTSACGLTIYRGDVFPEEFYGSVFLGEVAGNLIHHQRLSAQSVTFTSQRSNPNREFLTSTDNWFRPVNFVNAPDGTLHMLDMYRETIEHPWSIPDDIKSRVDLRSGSDRGRIYRIAPIGFRPARPKPQLHKASTAELVAMLSHPSSWWRETAHRLLYERLDSAAVPPLEAVARSQSSQQLHGQDFGAIARLNAIWLLFGLHNLSDEVLLHSLNDTAASVREHAVMLCEERLTSSKSLQKKIVSMADTELSPRVRFQLAFVLSALANHAEKPLRDSAVQPLAALARNSFEDRWIRTAVLCSSLSIAAPVSAEIMASESFGTKPMERSWLYDVAVMIGGRAVRDDVLAFLKNLRQWSKSQSNSEAQARLDGQLQAIQGLLDGLERAKRKMADVMMGDRSSELELIENALLRAAQVAIDRTNENSVRLSAIGLLKHVDISRAREVAQRLLVPDESSDVQSAALRLLASFRDDTVPPTLLRSMRGLPASARAQAIEGLLGRREWHTALLDGIESGAIRAGEVPHARRNLLLRSTIPEVKDRAVRLIQAALMSRREVVERYRREMDGKQGQLANGQIIYRRECSSCHRLDEDGQPGVGIGPNLSSIRNRTTQEVLLHVLDPNREVAPNFVSYVVSLDDGRTISGIVTDENAASISIRTAAGTLEVVDRTRIDQFVSSGMSLMPEGLEERITPTEMCDLLTYVMGSQSR